MENDKFPLLRAFLRARTPAEQKHFAKECRTTIGYLRKVLCKRNSMDVALVARIVDKSEGAIPADELRPDVDWDDFWRLYRKSRVRLLKRAA